MIIEQLPIPILQAPIGSIANPTLAAAVSNAGGMGSLALTWTKPDLAKKQLLQLIEQTLAPFFVNFVLAFPPIAFEAVLEVGVPAITFSFGHAPDLMRRAQAQGILVGVQVGNLQGGQQAINDGADFIICQGMEAGGHVQSSTPLHVLLSQVAKIGGKIPIIAAGGISSALHIYQARQAGATGVMLGTRFVATKESRAHAQYKDALVSASSSDTAYTLCFDGGWPQAAHRVLRNSTFLAWEAAGCPSKGSRPGEGDVVATTPTGSELLRYDDSPPLISMEGDVLACCLYAGEGVGKIDDIPSVNTLMKQLWHHVQLLKSGKTS